MAKFNLTGNTTVAELKKAFNDAFGSQIKVYNGGRESEDTAKLSELGLKEDGALECRSSLTAGSFVERMAAYGLKVAIWTRDYNVKVLDQLTLESTGKVKNMARKKDMEDMVAYQRKEKNVLDNSSNLDETGNIMSNKNHKFWIIISGRNVRYYSIDEKQCLDYYKEEEGFEGDFRTLLLDKGTSIDFFEFSEFTDYIQEIHSIIVAKYDCNEETINYKELLDIDNSVYSEEEAKFCNLHVPDPNDFNGAVVKEFNTDNVLYMVESENFEIGKLSIQSVGTIDYDGKLYQINNVDNVDCWQELYLDGELLASD